MNEKNKYYINKSTHFNHYQSIRTPKLNTKLHIHTHTQTVAHVQVSTESHVWNTLRLVPRHSIIHRHSCDMPAYPLVYELVTTCHREISKPRWNFNLVSIYLCICICVLIFKMFLVLLEKLTIIRKID